MLGKVSKAIATTMNLDSNALLKSMLTSQDVNDANKIPTASLLYSIRQNLQSQISGKIDTSKIVNNLLSTDASTVLSGAMGKNLADKDANLQSQITRLNGDLYKWLNVTRLDTGNDVNDLPSPSLAYSYSTASHAPFDGISANILTIGIDGYKAQIAFGVSRDSVQVKVRTSYDFVWQGWRSVTLS